MDHNQITEYTVFSKINLSLYGIYIFINYIFIWKYLDNYPPWMTLLSAAVLPVAAGIIFFKQSGPVFRGPQWEMIYFLFITACSVSLVFLLFQFNPEKIEVGRLPALNDWLDRLLEGKFPYYSRTNPSGFPFLFILALPFKFLGDPGLFQVFGFILFSYIVYRRYQYSITNRFRIMIPLLISPVFMYEVAVRSELFTNMVIVIFYLMIYDFVRKKMSIKIAILLGLLGGLILSTRGVVLPIYIIYFGYLIRNYKVNLTATIISAGIGFLLTIIPFIYWNSEYFFRYGPFAIQMSYIPTWLLILVLLVSAVLGRHVNTHKKSFQVIAFVMFGIVASAFAISMIKEGFYDSVIGDQFDISYYCFALPFILLSFDFPGRQS